MISSRVVGLLVLGHFLVISKIGLELLSQILNQLELLFGKGF